MGSKNLKAIAVKGSGVVEPVEPARFDGVVKECLHKINASAFAQGARRYGVYRKEPWGTESPYRNFSGDIPDNAKKQKIMPEEFLPFMIGSRSCGSCPMQCWKVHQIPGDGKPVRVEALQVNTLHNFAARLDLFDPETVLRAHALCNDLGLDQDNASGNIAWAIECFEKGLISREHTDGLELEWGKSEVIFELFHRMAHRIGFGDLLAEGCVLASEKLPGTKDCCIHIKGQPLFEVLWACPGWALGTVVAARGGTHTRGAAKADWLQHIPESLCQQLFGIPSAGDPFAYEDKERLVFFFENLQALSNSLGMCYFMHGLSMADMLLPEDYARLYASATGQEVNTERMMWLGERIFNLEKSFNVLHTRWTREDDMPPKRFTDAPGRGT